MSYFWKLMVISSAIVIISAGIYNTNSTCKEFQNKVAVKNEPKSVAVQNITTRNLEKEQLVLRNYKPKPVVENIEYSAAANNRSGDRLAERGLEPTGFRGLRTSAYYGYPDWPTEPMESRTECDNLYRPYVRDAFVYYMGEEFADSELGQRRIQEVLNIIWNESKGDSNAKSPESSATGVMQFLDSWKLSREQRCDPVISIFRCVLYYTDKGRFQSDPWSPWINNNAYR